MKNAVKKIFIYLICTTFTSGGNRNTGSRDVKQLTYYTQDL